MTLPEELRQASRYTALDHHRDLLERAAADAERKAEALHLIANIDPIDAVLDPQYARRIARAALSTQGEKT